jgi:predicted AAA+ superfamily ATPase
MIIERKLFKEIEKYLESKEAIIVTGMRRVGKTTLLNFFYKKIPSENKIFLDLEDPLNQRIFKEESYTAIKANLERIGFDFSRKGYIFLDEIQTVKNLPSIIKYFYDHYQIKFFLSGSASFYLKNLFSESLAGRKFVFELYPLDFEEFLWFKKFSAQLPSFDEKVNKFTYLLFAPLVKEYLEWGGMPEIVLKEDQEEKRMALRDIFTSYFQKEVMALGDFRKNEVVRELIFLLAKRTGQKVDIQRISVELGVTRQSISEYLEFLNKTYLISLLRAMGEVDVSVRKQKKVYFIDTGFFSFLHNISGSSIFENAVYAQLRDRGEVFYFEKRGQEIDFILKMPSGEKIAFEVKETPTLSDIKRVKRVSNKLGIKKSFILSLNFSEEDGVKYLFQLPKLM